MILTLWKITGCTHAHHSGRGGGAEAYFALTAEAWEPPPPQTVLGTYCQRQGSPPRTWAVLDGIERIGWLPTVFDATDPEVEALLHALMQRWQRLPGGRASPTCACGKTV